MSNVVWVDPVVNRSGTIKHEEHSQDMVVGVNTDNFLSCGFYCVRNNFTWLMSDRYEATNHQGFVEFSIHDTVNPITTATLYMYLSSVALIEAKNLLDYVDVQVWTTTDVGVHYPWADLAARDYPMTVWTLVGTLGNIRSSKGTTGWAHIDVTTAINAAIAAGLDSFAVRLTPSHLYPSDWNYNNAPSVGSTSINEVCAATFYGSRYPIQTSVLPGTYGADTNIMLIYPRPYLKLEYGTTPSVVTPSNITAITADSKAKLCLAGTVGGSLWKIAKAPSGWSALKVHYFDEQITSLCIDPRRNFKDYPDTPLVWLGTVSGRLFRTYGFTTWIESVKAWGDYPIVDIKISDSHPSLLAFGAGRSICISTDGGTTWTAYYLGGTTSNITGVDVAGTEIQVCYASDGASRSPDFGRTWYAAAGEPSAVTDITFSRKAETRSVILSASSLYKYSSGDTTFNYVAGAAVAGTPVNIVADPNGELMVIGTNSAVYQTLDWGNTVSIIETGSDIRGVAIGGDSLYIT